MKVIFLDTLKALKSDHPEIETFGLEEIGRLKVLVDQTEAKLVISKRGLNTVTLRKLYELFPKNNIPYWIGVSEPCDSCDDYWCETGSWLIKNDPMNEFKESAVIEERITDEFVAELIKILN